MNLFYNLPREIQAEILVFRQSQDRIDCINKMKLVHMQLLEMTTGIKSSFDEETHITDYQNKFYTVSEYSALWYY